MNKASSDGRTLPILLAPGSTQQVGVITLTNDMLDHLAKHINRGGNIHLLGDMIETRDGLRIVAISFLYFNRIKPVEECTNEELLNIVLTRMKDNL